jgi:hypothetical protein
MNPQAQDPLANLRDIHLPDPITSWVPAPGWWIVALTVIGLSLLVFYVRARRQGSARRMALRELDVLVATSADLQQLATGFSALLRRVAIVRYGAGAVASLHGKAWAEFLQAHSDTLHASVGVLLAQSPYAPEELARQPSPEAATREQLILETRHWIRRNS